MQRLASGRVAREAEETLWLALRAAGLAVGCVREHEWALDLDPPRRWCADFAWPEERVMVEVDGMHGRDGHVGGHRSLSGAQRDRERDRAAQSAGWLVLRYTTKEAVNDPCGCADQVGAVLSARRKL